MTHKEDIKVRFVSRYHHGVTAGLVCEKQQLRGKSIGDISKSFPYAEVVRMDRLERSPLFSTWEEAFEYEFTKTEEGQK